MTRALAVTWCGDTSFPPCNLLLEGFATVQPQEGVFGDKGDFSGGPSGFNGHWRIFGGGDPTRSVPWTPRQQRGQGPVVSGRREPSLNKKDIEHGGTRHRAGNCVRLGHYHNDPGNVSK